MKRVFIWSFVVVAAVVAGHGFAQEGGQPAAPPWAALTDAHAKMKESCGEFEIAAKMWMAPGQPPMEFPARAKRTMILGGHYLREEFSCDFMGMEFRGELTQAYDPIKKEYVNHWIDNMSNIPGTNRGNWKDGVLVTEGEEIDNMTGQMKRVRTRVTPGENGKIKVEMFRLEGEEEQPAMLFHYTPVKKKETKDKRGRRDEGGHGGDHDHDHDHDHD